MTFIWKGNDHSKLEVYDHFLPQGKYPFSVVNFKNLAPMCHECNSSYKHDKNPLLNIDPISKTGKRRKAFYPYSSCKWKIDLKLTGPHFDFKRLTTNNIQFEFSSGGRIDHLDSWTEVFGIEERYRAKILAKHAEKKWYSDIVDGVVIARKKLNNPGLTVEQWLEYKLDECDVDP